MHKLVAASAVALALATLPLTAAHANSTWSVGSTASTTSTLAGHKVVFTGVVRPKAAASGGKVVLQEKFKPGEPWVTQRKATISHGRYSVLDRPASNTLHSYRVVMPATAHRAAGVSPTTKVRVYGWQYLADKPAERGQGMVTGATDIDGTTYQNSLYSDAGATTFRAYNLGHRCLKLRATFGITDDSTADGGVELIVRSDGLSVYDESFGLGQSEKTTIDLAKPLKLRLESSQDGASTDTGYGAYASAQVLCMK